MSDIYTIEVSAKLTLEYADWHWLTDDPPGEDVIVETEPDALTIDLFIQTLDEAILEEWLKLDISPRSGEDPTYENL